MPTLKFDAIQHPDLILNREELDAIRTKINTQEWAKETFEKLIQVNTLHQISSFPIKKANGHITTLAKKMAVASKRAVTKNTNAPRAIQFIPMKSITDVLSQENTTH